MSAVPEVCKLERYFAKYEFSTKYLLCCSDVEALSMSDVIKMADPECKALWDNLKLSYTESDGHPAIRREVASLHGVHPEEVLLICPQEGIYIAMHCIVDYVKRTSNITKPHIITTFPGYQSLYQNVKTLQCEVDYWTVKETESGWKFDVNELKNLIRDDTKLLVVNFPHNPTGTIPSEEEWQMILELCMSRDIFLFSDEMYRLTNNDDSIPLDSACQTYSKAVTLFGMSKTYGMPGVRLGWLCTRHAELMQMLRSFKDYTTICSPGPCEILTIIALRNKEAILERTMGILRSNLKVLNKFLGEHSDVFEWHPPKACTTGLLKLKGWILEQGTGGASGFCEVLAKETGILLLPSALYDFPDQYVRISFARKDLPEVIDVFRKYLEKKMPKIN